MTRISRMTRLRLILTGVMLTVYLLVLALQAHAETGRTIFQNENTTYFTYSDTSLSPAAKHRLDEQINDLKAMGKIRGARIVGFADRTGSPSRNEKISRMRAEKVRNYLVSKGIVNANVADMRWFRDSYSATNCPESLPKAKLIACLQQDRKVEVEFDYTVQLAKAQ